MKMYWRYYTEYHNLSNLCKITGDKFEFLKIIQVGNACVRNLFGNPYVGT